MRFCSKACWSAGSRWISFPSRSQADPRPVVEVTGAEGFRFVEVVNRRSDALRRSVGRAPLLRTLASRNDSACYNRLLVRSMQAEHARRRYDVMLWMGDYAHGSVPGVPTISFAQGAPGSDARSLLRRGEEVKRLAGSLQALKWQALARLRLSSLGLPRFECSDHIIVGSGQSKKLLHFHHLGIPLKKVSSMPYPIDLDLFDLPPKTISRAGQASRVLWLGRIVPRKRLDLFLEWRLRKPSGEGADVCATVVGSVGLVRGYEKLIAAIPFSERLTWIPAVTRPQVPALMAGHDVLAQPSEEEDFWFLRGGSPSVRTAGDGRRHQRQCGLPLLAGHSPCR